MERLITMVTTGASRDWRRIAFFAVTVLAALFFLVFFGSVFAAFSP